VTRQRLVFAFMCDEHTMSDGHDVVDEIFQATVEMGKIGDDVCASSDLMLERLLTRQLTDVLCQPTVIGSSFMGTHHALVAVSTHIFLNYLPPSESQLIALLSKKKKM
jgi:hypothetical protein